ncbi:uncharacterized protein LOC135157130 [Lytechinus pictus]|uniref:uncharacterized protein LOC135157130 n=1 Tax=Lytechinus pictus TaxID=7653 RepID=UPI0030BA0C5E
MVPILELTVFLRKISHEMKSLENRQHHLQDGDPSTDSARAIFPVKPRGGHQNKMIKKLIFTDKPTEDKKKALFSNNFDPVKDAFMEILKRNRDNRTSHEPAKGGEKKEPPHPDFAQMLELMDTPTISRKSDRINVNDFLMNAFVKDKSPLKILPMLMPLLKNLS